VADECDIANLGDVHAYLLGRKKDGAVSVAGMLPQRYGAFQSSPEGASTAPSGPSPRERIAPAKPALERRLVGNEARMRRWSAPRPRRRGAAVPACPD
jgi:hypothetical protein